MNDRNKQIDEFLKYFRDIALQNPGYRFSKENIYSELTVLGLPKSEKKLRIDGFFSSWIQHFENHSKCNVFVSPNWKYFCQFVSNDCLAQQASEHLKVYIPLDSEHIEKGAKEIFEFLSNENISHVSKIGSHVRFDDIVVRLIEPSDVVKLVNFINNNKYIQEGLLPANPFTYSVNGLAMAVDGHLSFNSTVASLVQFYINNKIDNNMLNTVGVEDFYQFVHKYYNQVFSSAQGLQKLSNDFSLANYSNTAEILNYKNVLELLLKARNNSFTFENYIAHYNNCSNTYIQNQEINRLEAIKNASVYDVENNDIVQRTNKMLLQLINVMSEKYKDQHSVLCAINNYIFCGNENYISRYKGLRELVVNSSFRDDLRMILQSKDIRFIEYAENLLCERKKEIIIDENYEKSVALTVQEILEVMTKKYGISKSRDNFIEFVKTGKPEMLTRDSNLRYRIVNSTFRMDLIKILSKQGIKLEDYINVLSKNLDLNNVDYLEQAVLATYSKYQKKYENVFSNQSGKNVVVIALLRLIQEGTYIGFTRENGARKNLQTNISPSEVMNIIKKSFPFEKFQELSGNIIILLEEYVEIILQNNNIKKL